MTPRPTHETVAGHAYLRLRTLAKRAGRATEEYHRLYALEGFLARLAASASSRDLVLKGGVLLAAYELRRPTADIDLSGLALSNDIAAVIAVVVGVASTPPPQDDGLIFDTADAAAEAIREEDEYSGVRVKLRAQLATARLPFHVDVNVGDPIWPAPQNVTLPRLLGGEIELLGYPIPMVLAEKLVTALERAAANTRWRDFADVYMLTRAHEVGAAEAHAAITVVANHRNVELRPLRDVLAGFAEAGQARWVAWRDKNNLADRLPSDFAAVVDQVLEFAAGCFGELDAYETWSPIALRWIRNGVTGDTI